MQLPEFITGLPEIDMLIPATTVKTSALKSNRGGGALRVFAQPKLRPGVVIEVADLPQGLAKGPFWLDRVRHTLTPEGAVTTARFKGGGDRAAPSLLAGLGL